MSVSIAGIGTVTAAGVGVERLLGALIEPGTQPEVRDVCRQLRVKQFTVDKTNLQSFSWISKRVGDAKVEALIARAKRLCHRQTWTVRCAVHAVLEAWIDADFHLCHHDPARVGIVVSGCMYNDHFFYENVKANLIDGAEGVPARFAYQSMDSNLLGVLSEIFSVQGMSYTISGATASGNMALASGAALIEAGTLDHCLVVAPPVQLAPPQLSAFLNLGIFEHGSGDELEEFDAGPPFDETCRGVIPGEMSGCIVLSPRGPAEFGGYARIIGTAAGLDARYGTSPDWQGQASVLRGALKNAGLDASHVSYINAHGTGTKVGDRSELDAIKSVFASHFNGIRVNSTKSIIGHGMTSAGVVEMIAVVLQMKHKFLHANRGLRQPIDRCGILVGSCRQAHDFNYAVSNSYGFSGINTSIVLAKEGIDGGRH